MRRLLGELAGTEGKLSADGAKVAINSAAEAALRGVVSWATKPVKAATSGASAKRAGAA